MRGDMEMQEIPTEEARNKDGDEGASERLLETKTKGTLNSIKPG